MEDEAPGTPSPARRGAARPVCLAVVGAGTMGTGIATLAVGQGLRVVLVDVDEAALARARAAVERQLRLARMAGRLPRDGRPGDLVLATRIEDIAEATAVVEAVPEVARTKAEVLAAAGTSVAPGTLLASTTSAVPIDEQARSLRRPQDLVGIHFMNPPYLIRTVELIRGRRTGDAAMAAATALLSSLGQTPIAVGDGPGFVINRILQRMINEAARIVEEGLADPVSVDAAFERCLGHATGPLATADLIGLDNVVDSLRVLYERTGDSGYRPCRLLVEKVAAGSCGRKSGQGIFVYEGTRP